MLNFKPLELDDIQKFRPFFLNNTFGICDFTVGGYFMWAEHYGYSCAVKDGYLFTRSINIDKKDETVYPLPLPLNGGDIVSGIRLLFEEIGSAATVNPVPEAVLPQIQAAFPNCKITGLSTWSDYIYSAKELATLPGHAFASKRNLVINFEDNYPDFEFINLTQANAAEVIAYEEEWARSRGHEFTAMQQYENARIREILENFTSYGFVGGILKVEDTVCGFTCGEVIGDTLFSHIERADIHRKGSYQVVNMKFAQKILKEYGVKFINREDDAGSDALRQAKQSYNPVKMGKKFSVSF
ncbi:MAG: phosphatidylglycerol lysyltransferase domain-containing protein [Christensenellaceae bacterium]|jgi:hypothetical protein|nr:phosphatidylglycerol lysyltransferase domain-containing protein [Christensenellaceae bacterium]